MGETRRKADDGTSTRQAILDATETIMREEGYAAVSSRRVAEVAGLKSQLVHYHFGTMDNLFLALFRRSEEEFMARQVMALTSGSPVRALWEQSLRQADTRLTIEFIALAVHRPALRDELARANAMTRRVHTTVLATALAKALAKDPAREELAPPPEVLAFLIAAVTRTLVTEEALGEVSAHAAVHDYVDACLARWDGPPAAPAQES